MGNLIGFVNILGMYMATDVRDPQYSQKRTGHEAPRAAHGRRLEEMTAPLGGPLDDHPLGVVVGLVREMGRWEKASEIVNRGHRIGEGLVEGFHTGHG